MAETQSSSFADVVREARQRLEQELRAQAERFEKLHTELTELRQLHERTEQEAGRQWDEVARAGEQAVTQAAEVAAAKATEAAEGKAAERAAQAAEAAAAKATEAAEAKAAERIAQVVAAQIPPEKVLQGILGALRGLMACTIPEQVLEVLTQEAAKAGVRAAIFDVRGKAAWGAAATGFGPALTEKVLRGLIIPLNQDNPFRQVYETAVPVEANADTLKKNRNILDRLKPAPHAPVLLVPIRSAGAVSAILYVDPGEKSDPLPVNALEILSEFAGAQIDRLIALSGGAAAEGAEGEVAKAAGQGAPVQEAEEAAAEVHAEEAAPVEAGAKAPAVAEAHAVEAAVAVAPKEAEKVAPPVPAPEAPAPPAVGAVAPPAPAAPPVEAAPPPPAPPSVGVGAETVPPAALSSTGEFDIAHLSEAMQKVHKDARRFAKLLVSEIELYNKAKVADGRKSRDLYKRLKSDIDRSRQAYEKRFGKILAKQVDYFHVELVKTLAVDDPSALGPEYPGPAA